MRIGIDIRPMLSEGTGVGSYTLNLVKNLGALDTKNKYILFSNSFKDRVRFESLGLPPNFELKDYRIPNRILRMLWNRFSFPPVEVFIKEADIFHSPHSIPIPIRKAKLIVTIHDLFFLKYPEMVGKDVREDHKKILKGYVPKIKRIITVSYHSKKDIIELLNINPEIVDVIYEGVDSIFRVINDRPSLEKIRERYKLPQEFILFVGTIEPRKNPNTLLEAIALLREKGLKNLILVMVGPMGWKSDETLRLVSMKGLGDCVRHIGYIPHEDIPFMYNAAKLLVYTSLYEGFGLPPLEAMACGIPVIASNLSSMPEILGDAALLVNPYDPYEIAGSIERVLYNESLRNSLVEKGLKKAKLYSWVDTARNILKVYQEVSEDNE